MFLLRPNKELDDARSEPVNNNKNTYKIVKIMPPTGGFTVRFKFMTLFRHWGAEAKSRCRPKHDVSKVKDGVAELYEVAKHVSLGTF